jgi:hypothetical protein
MLLNDFLPFVHVALPVFVIFPIIGLLAKDVKPAIHRRKNLLFPGVKGTKS